DIGANLQTTTSQDGHVHEVEQKMKDICKNVLRLERIGVHDNLFELGSDSIRIGKIYTEMKKIHLPISIKDLFYYETIRSVYLNCIKPNTPVAQTVHEDKKVVYSGFNEIKQHLTEQINEFNDMILGEEIIAKFPTSSIQRITWEINRTYSGAIMKFNQQIDLKLLKKSIASVIEKQGMLRSNIVMTDGRREMEERDMVENLDIPYLNLENTSKNVKNQVIHFIVDKLYSENLGDKNEVLHRLLYKVIIVKLNRTHYKVYMPFNHLIFDGMSMEVIKTNIRRAYANN